MRPPVRGIKRRPRSDYQRMVAPSLVSCAIEALKRARADLAAAGAQVALARVRSAIESAEGALRHAERTCPLRVRADR